MGRIYSRRYMLQAECKVDMQNLDVAGKKLTAKTVWNLGRDLKEHRPSLRSTCGLEPTTLQSRPPWLETEEADSHTSRGRERGQMKS